MTASAPAAFPLTPAGIRAIVRDSVPSRSCCADDGHTGANGCVVAIGAFDGVHRGHQRLLESCVADARQRLADSVVVTFDPDPSELLAGPDCELRLLSVNDRVSLCRSLGIDRTLVLPFSYELSRCSPDAFVDLIAERLPPLASVHVGTNFRFGHRGAGDVRTLATIGDGRGFAVVAHPLLQLGGSDVSSTRIRGLLSEGKVAEAAELLGRHHMVRGVVSRGRGEATSFGFPTANVVCDSHSCLPAEGVYGCIVTDGRRAWPSAVNVGKPPTFTDERDHAFLEANLIGFEGNLYGSELSVVFVAWLRPSRRFDSFEELEQTVLGNIAWVRDNIGSAEVEVDRD